MRSLKQNMRDVYPDKIYGILGIIKELYDMDEVIVPKDEWSNYN